jgi:signal transduction histidine kinase
LSLEPVDPNTVLEASLEQLKPMLQVQEIHASTDLEEDLPTLWVDWMVAQRVIENLLDNAIKSTPPGGEITLRSRLEDGRIILSVQDTGSGIPDDQKQTMTEKFSQMSFEDAFSTALVERGFGLGLAFCKLATDAMQGHIWVNSELGSGSTFYVAFPVRTEPEHHE